MRTILKLRPGAFADFAVAVARAAAATRGSRPRSRFPLHSFVISADISDEREQFALEVVAGTLRYSPSPVFPIHVPSDLAALTRRPRSSAMRASL